MGETGIDDAEHENDGYDIFSDDYGQNPHPFWASIAANECPMSKTSKWGGAWMFVKYKDMQEIIQDPERYSSRAVEAAGVVPAPGREFYMPPVTSPPSEHAVHRRVIATMLTPLAIGKFEPAIRAEAAKLAAGLARRGGGDASADFARPLTLSVLMLIFDLPATMHDQFVDWAVRILRLGPTDQELRKEALNEVASYLDALISERTASPGEDIVSHVARATIGGKPLSRKHMIGTLMELVLAGADTTWSTLGASLLHLATHPNDRAKLAAEPALISSSAVEEFLRLYSPVLIARILSEDTVKYGRCMRANERIILPTAAANRDPEFFENPNEARIDRRPTRHLAFGTGIHRCVGSHLARTELVIALEEWLRVMPDFELTDRSAVLWAKGQVRGPDTVLFKTI